jgi:hypothetical protein
VVGCGARFTRGTAVCAPGGAAAGQAVYGAGFIAADLRAADREAQTLVAGLSEQQMNWLHHVESLKSTIFAAISSVSYQEPPVSVWRLCYFPTLTIAL